jgi:chaperonin cofactor prefoldin
MSDEPTADIAEKYDTKPTIDTLLEELRSFRTSVEQRFDSLDVRLDRIESVAHDTQSKFHALRADFNEFKKELREHFPSAVK